MSNGGKNRIPLEGTTKGYWSVGERVDDNRYICTCVCGLTRVIAANALNRGDTKSCGCMAAELRKASAKMKKAPFKSKDKYE